MNIFIPKLMQKDDNYVVGAVKRSINTYKHSTAAVVPESGINDIIVD